MATSATERAVVSSIYQLARALNLRVIAEGVEDGATASQLAARDGVVGQGYYFARPMPAANLVDWLRARSVL